ncbi:hypothetical protein [Enterovibrio coralii]|uniref:Uncharacterized protein n=1 Tax=Enterovibrio coralii TaxID=294935 RepID=A0A135IBY3_9GAMM|nr:hypothetical protein [Enterovibrio coralii]KXF82977.1 hypothetical protein ATN88_04285 [Enterovibrio coralii]
MDIIKLNITLLFLLLTIHPNNAIAKRLSIEIRTAIEQPDCQAGTKSTQTIVVNTKTRTINDSQHSTGTTNILGCEFGSINDSFKTVGHYQTVDSIKFEAVGTTATIVTLGIGPSIDYAFSFYVDTKNETVTLAGEHDGYPTYYVNINNKPVYKFDQTTITSLADPMEIKVPSTVFHYGN